MNKNFLFALDTDNKEVIVSNSPKGTNKINFIERVSLKDNEILYNAVHTLTSISKSSNFNINFYTAMDKVCQMIYNNHVETNQN